MLHNCLEEACSSECIGQWQVTLHCVCGVNELLRPFPAHSRHQMVIHMNPCKEQRGHLQAIGHFSIVASYVNMSISTLLRQQDASVHMRADSLRIRNIHHGGLKVCLLSIELHCAAMRGKRWFRENHLRLLHIPSDGKQFVAWTNLYMFCSP